ncbi:MAG: AAA family ATPase [Spirochaetaceae bacterium]|nr:AAA family ATPase [Spirochaetaceae bacterium]
MRLKSISLENWKNFRSLHCEINDRLFVVGANASGKSNFLDALRFMRDIVKHGGGLQYAVSQRGGISKIRCLSARENPFVVIELEFIDDNSDKWKYTLSLTQQTRGNRNPIIRKEIMLKNGQTCISRPDHTDEEDEERLTQTYIEQITMNKDFRDIVNFLGSIQYMHLVPQLLKFPEAFSGPDLPEDPFGKGFLRTVAKTPSDTRNSRLSKIQGVLQIAVPQLKDLKYIDDIGQPHLEVTYEHWRPNGAKQTETQLSDGTLRLIGLLWSLFGGKGILLIEEPELSLHAAIVEQLPELFHSILRSKKRQLIITTHSPELLSHKGISLSEILMLQPENEGTKATLAKDRREIASLLKDGLTPAEAILPYTRPNIIQGLLFE